MIAFTVSGMPAPKGSTKAFVVRGRAVVTEDNTHTRPWAALVRDAAREAHAHWVRSCGWGMRPANRASVIVYPRPVGVALSLEFALPRPTRLPKRRVVPPTTKPDLDKLCRCVKDALTGVIWTDDAQVVTLTASKRYAAPDEMPGVVVCVRDAVASRLEIRPVEATA